MICDWCREEILAGERYFYGEESGALHRGCVRAYMVDMVRHEFLPEECAEMLGMDEEVCEDGYTGNGRRKHYLAL